MEGGCFAFVFICFAFVLCLFVFLFVCFICLFLFACLLVCLKGPFWVNGMFGTFIRIRTCTE